MNDLKDAYPEMYLATAQARIRDIELRHRQAQWRVQRKQSRRRRRQAGQIERATPRAAAE
jgi:hypothetical protein